VWSPCGLLVAV